MDDVITKWRRWGKWRYDNFDRRWVGRRWTKVGVAPFFILTIWYASFILSVRFSGDGKSIAVTHTSGAVTRLMIKI